MGKLKHKKVWNSQKRRKQIERLLPTSEVYNEQELKERNKRISTAIRMRSYELEAEQLYDEARGTCKHCNMVRTTKLECPMGCKE